MPQREPVFTGTCTALVTPFTPTGEVWFERLGELIEDQIAAGIDALCVCGTTGETPTLSTKEHLDTISFCCETVNRRVPVLAGTGGNNTRKAEELSHQAQTLGADAVLSVTPYYNKATQEGLVRHFETIADAVEIPVILYNVPSRTGMSFTAETYERLAQHPNIGGVKEASGSLDLLSHTRRLCPDLPVWSGNDDQTVAMMSLGAKGVISVAANLLPEPMTRMTHLCLRERFDEAAELQLDLLPLLDALFCEVNPIPIKAALSLIGRDVGVPRLPLTKLSPEHKALLKRVLLERGLFQKNQLQ